jgi:CubicO group peptidase (beta-lactamase class C family)
MHAVSGEHADRIAAASLFGPMGISTCRWSFEGSLPQCHSDLFMRPVDMAKIGQLLLDDGVWNGKQLVPAGWVREATRPRVKETEFYDYGYFFWCRSPSNSPWWDLPENGRTEEHAMVQAMGFGGQYIMVIRDLDLVVVTTASDYADGHRARSKVPMVIERIVPLFSED